MFKWFYVVDFLWIGTFFVVLLHEILTPQTGFAIVGSIWAYAASIIGIIIGIVLFFVIRYLKKWKDGLDE